MLCVCGVFVVNTTSAGDLNPPAGPIAPTHKTLTQVEPRTPISAATTPGDTDSLFRITVSGSYYLTGNIAGVAGKSGIEIGVPDVTIDLNGFRLSGLSTSLSGIRATATLVGISIRNGSIIGWGGDGVDALTCNNAAVSGVASSSNIGNGISLGRDARVRDCTAFSNGLIGFRLDGGSVVQSCVAQQNGEQGFVINPETGSGNSTVSDCVARANGEAGFEIHGNVAISHCVAAENIAEGITIGSSGTVIACVAFDNGATGIDTAFALTPSVTGGQLVISQCASRSNGGNGIHIRTGNAIVTDCTVNFNTLNGIHAGGSTIVRGNVLVSNGNGGDGAGIFIVGSNCRIENNNVTSNDRGVDVDTSGCIIFGNTCSDNAINYDIDANNKVGVIISAPNSAVISGSTGGAGLGSTDPWANFSY